MRRVPPHMVAMVLGLGLLAACSQQPQVVQETVNDLEQASAEQDRSAAELTQPLELAVEPEEAQDTLRIGAIPDQDPEILNRLYGHLAAYLSEALDVPVEYVPVIDYAAAVTAFKVGDLDLVWFGGLTGVQARLQVPSAVAVAQRDIDEEFQSVFIAGPDVDIEPFEDLAGLSAMAGRSLTFGSESSTSGRLMPQYFMQQAGLILDDLAGEPGFSGSHDNTISVVAAGTYEVGALNKQVWDSRSAEGSADAAAVRVIFITPPYYDYHWVLHPSTLERYGEDFPAQVQQAFVGMDPGDPAAAGILEVFNADAFIDTANENYAEIEAVAREIGLIVGDE